MLIVALVLAVIGLAALVTAVVTSNELIAWVCIGASVIGVLLLIVDALRERSKGTEAGDGAPDAISHDGENDQTTAFPAVSESVPEAQVAEDYPEEPAEPAVEASTATHHEPETSTVGAETHDDGAGSEEKRD